MQLNQLNFFSLKLLCEYHFRLNQRNQKLLDNPLPILKILNNNMNNHNYPFTKIIFFKSYVLLENIDTNWPHNKSCKSDSGGGRNYELTGATQSAEMKQSADIFDIVSINIQHSLLEWVCLLSLRRPLLERRWRQEHCCGQGWQKQAG